MGVSCLLKNRLWIIRRKSRPFVDEYPQPHFPPKQQLSGAPAVPPRRLRGDTGHRGKVFLGIRKSMLSW